MQPRPTGQLLIGSSRQFDNEDRELDLPLLAAMLSRAQHFLPSLATLNIIRCWSGFRAASQDGNPLLGPHPSRAGVWLALGHEGLGVTTAPASASLLAAQLLGERSLVSPAPWLPARLIFPGGQRMSGTIRIFIAGQPWFVPTGISVAAALALTDNPITRLSVSRATTYALLRHGRLQECRVSINGRRVPGYQPFPARHPD